MEARNDDEECIDYFSSLVMLYSDVLPARAEKKGPCFRAGTLLYRQIGDTDPSTGCLSVKALLSHTRNAGPEAVANTEAAGPSHPREAHQHPSPPQPDVSQPWRYLAVVSCIEPSACPGRLVPLPECAWLLAFPTALDQKFDDVQQRRRVERLQPQKDHWHGEHRQEQQQLETGVSTEVVAQAAAVAMAAGWRPWPRNRQSRKQGTAAAGGTGDGGEAGAPAGGVDVSSSSGDGRDGGMCSFFPSKLMPLVQKDAPQVRLLLLYSEAVSEKAARLCKPKACQLPATGEDSDVVFCAFPPDEPVWAAVLAPGRTAAEVVAAPAERAAAQAGGGLSPCSGAVRMDSSQPCRDLHWPATLGGVQVLACTTQGKGAAVAPAADASLGPGAAPAPADTGVVSCLVRVQLSKCCLRVENVALDYEAVATLALEPYVTEPTGHCGGGGWEPAGAQGPGGGGGGAMPLISVDLELTGWTLRDLQSERPPVVPYAARGGGAAASAPRCYREGGIRRRRQQLLRDPGEDLDEQVTYCIRQYLAIEWLWHAPPGDDDGSGDDSDGEAGDDVKLPSGCFLDPELDPGFRLKQGDGAGPPDPAAASLARSRVPYERAHLGGGGGKGRVRLGRVLQRDICEGLTCVICNPDVCASRLYDNLACLMTHVRTCHGELAAALEYTWSASGASTHDPPPGSLPGSLPEPLARIHLMRSRHATDWRTVVSYDDGDGGGRGHKRPLEPDWVMYGGRIFEIDESSPGPPYGDDDDTAAAAAGVAAAAEGEGEVGPGPGEAVGGAWGGAGEARAVAAEGPADDYGRAGPQAPRLCPCGEAAAAGASGKSLRGPEGPSSSSSLSSFSSSSSAAATAAAAATERAVAAAVAAGPTAPANLAPSAACAAQRGHIKVDAAEAAAAEAAVGLLHGLPVTAQVKRASQQHLHHHHQQQQQQQQQQYRASPASRDGVARYSVGGAAADGCVAGRGGSGAEAASRGLRLGELPRWPLWTWRGSPRVDGGGAGRAAVPTVEFGGYISDSDTGGDGGTDGDSSPGSGNSGRRSTDGGTRKGAAGAVGDGGREAVGGGDGGGAGGGGAAAATAIAPNSAGGGGAAAATAIAPNSAGAHADGPSGAQVPQEVSRTDAAAVAVAAAVGPAGGSATVGGGGGSTAPSCGGGGGAHDSRRGRRRRASGSPCRELVGVCTEPGAAKRQAPDRPCSGEGDGDLTTSPASDLPIRPGAKRMRLHLPEPFPLVEQCTSTAVVAAMSSGAASSGGRNRQPHRRKTPWPQRVMWVSEYCGEPSAVAEEDAWLEAADGGGNGGDASSSGHGGGADSGGAGGGGGGSRAAGVRKEADTRLLGAGQPDGGSKGGGATDASALGAELTADVCRARLGTDGAGAAGGGEDDVIPEPSAAAAHPGAGLPAGADVPGPGGVIPASAAGQKHFIAHFGVAAQRRISARAGGVQPVADPWVRSDPLCGAPGPSTAGQSIGQPQPGAKVQPGQEPPSRPPHSPLMPPPHQPRSPNGTPGAAGKRPAAAAVGAVRRRGHVGGGRGGGRGGPGSFPALRAVLQNSTRSARPGLCQDFGAPRVFVHSRTMVPLCKEEVLRRFHAALQPASTPAVVVAAMQQQEDVGAAGVGVTAAEAAAAAAAGQAADQAVTTEAAAAAASAAVAAPDANPIASDSDSDTEDEEEWMRCERAHIAGLTANDAGDAGLPATSILTPAEQEIMVLWNRFARRRPLHSDRIVPQRCEEFVSGREGQEIAASRDFRQLRAALVIHLLTLHTYALVGPMTITRCLQRVDQLRQQHLEATPQQGTAAAAATTTAVAAAAHKQDM